MPKVPVDAAAVDDVADQAAFSGAGGPGVVADP